MKNDELDYSWCEEVSHYDERPTYEQLESDVEAWAFLTFYFMFISLALTVLVFIDIYD